MMSQALRIPAPEPSYDFAPDGETTDTIRQQIADWFAEQVDAIEGATRTVRVLIPREPAAFPPIDIDDTKACTNSGVECYVTSDEVVVQPSGDGVVAIYDMRVSEGCVTPKRARTAHGEAYRRMKWGSLARAKGVAGE